MTKLIPSLAFLLLSISSSVAVDVTYGFDKVEACAGDVVTVNWAGYHNIQETVGSSCDSGDLGEIEGYFNNGNQRTYSNDELTASPGETRYFKCDLHCGTSASRFEVSCPAADVDVTYGFDQVEACAGDVVTVNWAGTHNIQETVGSSCDSGDLGEIEGYLNNGDQRTYRNDELTASPGETRYFKCDLHCGTSASRFEVSCPSEPFVCANDRKYRTPNNKNCAWIGMKKNRRKKFCSTNAIIFEKCPVTCGVCCEDDVTFQFKLKSGKKKRCNYLNENKPKRMKYCKNALVRSSCPKKCNACYNK